MGKSLLNKSRSTQKQSNVSLKKLSKFRNEELFGASKISKYYNISGDGVVEISLDEAVKSRKFNNSIKRLSEFELETFPENNQPT